MTRNRSLRLFPPRWLLPRCSAQRPAIGPAADRRPDSRADQARPSGARDQSLLRQPSTQVDADRVRASALTLDDAVKLRARAQPRHRGAAAEPAAAGHRSGERAGVLPADAHVDGQPGRTTTTRRPASCSSRTGGGRRDQPDAGLQRRAHPEPAVGRRDGLRPRSTTAGRRRNSNNALFNPQYNVDLERRVHAAAAARLRGSTRTRPPAAGHADQPRHLRRPAAGVDHQHRVERPERVLGLRLRDAGGRRRAPVARARDQARRRTTRRASKSARWRRSTSCRRRPRQATRRQRLVTAENDASARPSSRSSG